MTMRMQISVTGLQEVQTRLTQFAQRHPVLVAKALTDEARFIMRESFYEVPYDTGSLRNSGFVDPPTISSRNISIKLGYGGPAVKVNPKSGQLTTVYAVEVHENMNTAHKIGKAKFLYDPIMRNAEKLSQRLVDSVERLLVI